MNQALRRELEAVAADPRRSLRIELDDEVLVDVRQDVVPRRHRLEDAANLLVVDLDPVGQADLLRDGQRALNAQLLARFLADLQTSPALHWYEAMVTDLLVDQHGLVAHELARFGARSREAHPVHDVVQAALEQLQQVLTGGAGAARGLLVVVGELPLEHAVHAAQLLLLAQLRP